MLCFTACDPQDNDSHNLGGQLVAESDISFSVTPTANQNEYIFTNTSKELPSDVKLVWDFADGKIVVTSPGDAVTKVYKKAGAYKVSILAFTKAGHTAVSQTVDVEKDFNEDVFAWTGFGFNSDDNLFKNATFTNEFFYADAGWNAYGEPSHTSDGNKKLELSYDKATVDQWQNQVHFITNIAVSSSKTYDFSVVIKATKDIPAVTVKVNKNGEDNAIVFFADKSVSLKANEMKVVYGIALPGVDGNAKITFDFGGSPENTGVEIYDIVLTEHNEANVAPLDYNSEVNIWKKVDEEKAFDMAFWWGDASWAQIGNPSFEQNGNVYTIVSKDATVAEWQAQNTFNTKSLALGADDVFDFSCIIKVSKDSRVTVKLCDQESDVNQAFYKNDIQLKAGEIKAVKLTDNKLSAGASAKVKLVFDFGGCQADTEFTIGNITLIKK